MGPKNDVLEFAKAILHGDEDHRAWLMEAAQAYLDGKKLPAPRGKGTKEHAA